MDYGMKGLWLAGLAAALIVGGAARAVDAAEAGVEMPAARAAVKAAAKAKAGKSMARTQGKVASVDAKAGRIVVENKRGKRTDLVVGQDAKVLRGGAPIRAEEVRAGEQVVSASYDRGTKRIRSLKLAGS